MNIIPYIVRVGDSLAGMNMGSAVGDGGGGLGLAGEALARERVREERHTSTGEEGEGYKR